MDSVRTKPGPKPSAVCKSCGVDKEISGKCRPCANATTKAWRNRNKEHIKEYAKEYYPKYAAENKEKLQAYHRDYFQARYVPHPLPQLSESQRIARRKLTGSLQQSKRRARLRAAHGEFTAAEWTAIKKRQKGRCNDCGHKTKLTIDHIVPLDRGGCNYAFNIQGLCSSCNSRKRNALRTDSVSLFDKVVT